MKRTNHGIDNWNPFLNSNRGGGKRFCCRSELKNTDMAAKEATHLRKVVPKPKLPSLVALLTSFLTANFGSFMSESIKPVVTGSVFMARYSVAILPIVLQIWIWSQLINKNEKLRTWIQNYRDRGQYNAPS